MKNWIIRTLGLKGSWSWAKRQMFKGNVVRSKSWVGALKLRVDSYENGLLQCCFWSENKKPPHGKMWDTSNHFPKKEDLTDYEIVEGWRHFYK